MLQLNGDSETLGNFRVDMFTSAGERSRRYSGESLTRREVDNVTTSHSVPGPKSVMARGRSCAAHPYYTIIAGTVTLNPVIYVTS
jgi:hypothetical protein